jgi:hypothetical protein
MGKTRKKFRKKRKKTKTRYSKVNRRYKRRTLKDRRRIGGDEYIPNPLVLPPSLLMMMPSPSSTMVMNLIDRREKEAMEADQQKKETEKKNDKWGKILLNNLADEMATKAIDASPVPVPPTRGYRTSLQVMEKRMEAEAKAGNALISPPLPQEVNLKEEFGDIQLIPFSKMKEYGWDEKLQGWDAANKYKNICYKEKEFWERDGNVYIRFGPDKLPNAFLLFTDSENETRINDLCSRKKGQKAGIQLLAYFIIQKLFIDNKNKVITEPSEGGAWKPETLIRLYKDTTTNLIPDIYRSQINTVFEEEYDDSDYHYDVYWEKK